MKKLIVLFLAVFIVLSLAACGGQESANTAAPSTTPTPAQQDTAGTPETAEPPAADPVENPDTPGTGGKILVAYFSATNNTEGIAQKLADGLGADLFEIQLVTPYSTDYNTVLDEAQRDQNRQARPELANQVANFDQYSTILLGYPNWWASIPMPIASFLEQYDFAGKTVIPFCSHGGGRFGQSLTAIAKLAPDANMGEPLSVHYSGGSSLPEDIAAWLQANGISG